MPSISILFFCLNLHVCFEKLFSDSLIVTSIAYCYVCFLTYIYSKLCARLSNYFIFYYSCSYLNGCSNLDILYSQHSSMCILGSCLSLLHFFPVCPCRFSFLLLLFVSCLYIKQGSCQVVKLFYLIRKHAWLTRYLSICINLGNVY